MKCMNCGAEIPEDQLKCPECGQEIQIVPDYNPLEDVLAAQVRGAVNETLTSRTGKTRTTGRIPQRTGHVSSRTGYMPAKGVSSDSRRIDGRTGKNPQAEREQRRRQAEKKKMLAKKRRMRMLIILAVVAVLGIIIGVVCYQNSYTGRVKKGERLLAEKQYDQALTAFKKAVAKNKKRGEAYTGISKVYIAQGDLAKAEQVFTDEIEKQSSNTELYRAAIGFYMDTEQESKVSVLLDACSSDRVLAELKEYVSEEPEFSLDDSETFDDVQELELAGSGKAIYYTTDGTEPDLSSTKYTEPIQIPEGETQVRAISVNKKGIPSLEVKKTFVVELPVADAPAVTPSTGQYESAQQITVKVPEGYTAYYTLNGSTPSPDSSDTYEYTGPIDMPEGNTIFSVVLKNKKGKLSDVTIRNYELILE